MRRVVLHVVGRVSIYVRGWRRHAVTKWVGEQGAGFGPPPSLARVAGWGEASSSCTWACHQAQAQSQGQGEGEPQGEAQWFKAQG